MDPRIVEMHRLHANCGLLEPWSHARDDTPRVSGLKVPSDCTNLTHGGSCAIAENGFKVELSMESQIGEDPQTYGPMGPKMDSQNLDSS